MCRGENLPTCRKKKSSEQGENQQKTGPSHGTRLELTWTESTWATKVAGECSHHSVPFVVFQIKDLRVIVNEVRQAPNR